MRPSTPVSLVALLLAAGAGAQADDPVARCAALADQDAEIACLRAALGDSGVEAPSPAPPPPPAVAPEQLGSEQVARVQEPVDTTSEPSRAHLRAAVSASSTDHIGRFTVRLDNGQVWRQIDPLAVPVRVHPDDMPAVEITRSGFGGYRMKFPASGRTVAVARVE